MVLIAARIAARLIALTLTAALAVAGLAIAVFSIQGDEATLSLPQLARDVRADDLRADVGGLLAELQAEGPVAKVAALAGAGAILLGLLLLFGVLGRRRERLVVIRSDDDGKIAARPRAVGQAAVTLAEQSRDVLQAKAKVRPRRRGGGRLRLTVYEARPADGVDANAASRDRMRTLAESESLRTLTESFSLRLRLRGRSRPSRRAAKVS